MPTVSLGLAQSIGSLVDRLPSWRDAGLLLRRGSRGPSEGAGVPLAAIIEDEIIPRLLMAHRTPDGGMKAGMPRAALRPGDVELFAPHLVSRETCELVGELDLLIARGVPADAILVDLFAPAARLLGEGWDEDRYDFVDVTMGLWRLQELVHELAARSPAPAPRATRRAFFASLPGDRHSFGVILIEEVFRIAGWDTVNWTEGKDEDFFSAVRRENFDLIGLSISQEQDVERAGPIISELREKSRNPSVFVMVGGPMLSARPELAIALGADATAIDARAALVRAEQLIGASALAASSC